MRIGIVDLMRTVQAFLMNLEGQKSNVVEYTIHCNGG